MKIRPGRHLLLPLLALSVTLAWTASVRAQDRQHQGPGGTSATLRINFGTAPHWVDIPGTRVRTVREQERPGYDVFQYGGSYYAYDNDRWYRSSRESGDFREIDESSVPSEFSSIPREHWRSYPSRWQDRQRQGPGGPSATLQVSFGTAPHWVGIRGTRVRTIRQGERPDYDLFQYGRNFYAYSNDRWYMSPRPRGQFTVIDERFVPTELSRVPRGQWRNYPSGWSDQRRDPRFGGNDRRR